MAGLNVVVMQTPGSPGPVFQLPRTACGAPILPRMGETLRLPDGYSYLVTNVLYSLHLEGTNGVFDEIRVMVKRK